MLGKEGNSPGFIEGMCCVGTERNSNLLSSGPWLELSLPFLSVITLVTATVSQGSYED